MVDQLSNNSVARMAISLAKDQAMSLTLLAVTYTLTAPAETFKTRASDAAVHIADAPGLRWKIWGLDPATGEGTSFYLFRDRPSAEDFAEGPAIAALRSGPARQVLTRVAPIDVELSSLTHAAEVLVCS
jgi:hypothetical protein